MIIRYSLAFIISITVILSSLSAQPLFGTRKDICILPDIINEASGIVASGQYSGMYWIHNDSGDEPRLFLMDSTCGLRTIFRLPNNTHRDWEDIAIGKNLLNNTFNLYIGDIGDNNAIYPEKSIIRITEPAIPAGLDTTLYNSDILRFQYPDGNRDAETLLCDPLTQDLYIVSKREDSVRVYLFSYPQSTDSVTILKKVSTLPLSGIVGGDISFDGTEILLKNYTQMFYWKKQSHETIAKALSRPSISVPYEFEPQGEAVCWTSSGNGYMTVSEESPFSIPSHLYFYPRLIPTDIYGTQQEENSSIHIVYRNLHTPLFSIPCHPGAQVHAQIYDILGNSIHTLFHDKVHTNILQCEWETSVHGIYWCHVTVNNSATTTLFYIGQ